MQLRRDLNIRQATAWRLLHCIREAMDAGDPLFIGPAEAPGFGRRCGGRFHCIPSFSLRRRGLGSVRRRFQRLPSRRWTIGCRRGRYGCRRRIRGTCRRRRDRRSASARRLPRRRGRVRARRGGGRRRCRRRIGAFHPARSRCRWALAGRRLRRRLRRSRGRGGKRGWANCGSARCPS